jgi:hypothetical protein
MIELHEVRELVCQILKGTLINVNKISRWHWSVSDILCYIRLLVEETCICKVMIASLILGKEVCDVWIYP